MNESMACLSPERLRELAHEDLPPQQWAEWEEHLTQCDKCRQVLEQFDDEDDWQDDVRSALSEGVSADGSRVTETSSFEEPQPDAGLQNVLAMLVPTDDPRMLGRIGTYEIVGVLGRGGMGVVFKGFDAALNRYVAIKMLLPHLATSGAARKRFAREAQAAAAVVNDHVMAIHAVAEWQGMPYLVMPYGRGSSLQKRLNDEGPLEVAEVLRIGMQTARALAAAHAQGLVHRDVKPANILLDEGVERVTLTDFGLARAVDDISLTRVGMLAGTPQFMSPEQARGQSIDARSDLFSLGSVMYAMCTGHAPFRAESSYGVLRQITDSQPRCLREINPAVPEWLERIVMKLLAKDAGARFASASEVATVLEQCLGHVQQPTVTGLPDFVAEASGLARPGMSVVARSEPDPVFHWPWFRLLFLAVVVPVGIAGGIIASNIAGQQLFYGPAWLFVGHPERAYLVTCVFGALLWIAVRRTETSRAIAALLSAGVWACFGAIEQWAGLTSSNIRVDVIFTWPIVLAVTAGCCGVWAFDSRRRNLETTTPRVVAPKRLMWISLVWTTLFATLFGAVWFVVFHTVLQPTLDTTGHGDPQRGVVAPATLDPLLEWNSVGDDLDTIEASIDKLDPNGTSASKLPSTETNSATPSGRSN